MAGEDWMYGFLNRHQNLSLRTPEATSVARAQGFNKKAVTDFFEIWKKVLEDKKFQAHSIFNYDETGCTTVADVPKVLAPKGLKQVGQITASERGVLVTVACCVSASGRAVPPVMVFPRVHYKDWFIHGAPPGTLGLATQSGWMTADLFPRVLAHIIKNIGCSIKNPAVLLMDNHESHLSLEALDLAHENGLTLVTFPPHCSHRLQPLDVSFYGPLKSYYKKALNDRNLGNPGKRPTIYDIPECVKKAFNKAANSETITSGFKRSGIWPLNSEIFTDNDFMASKVFQPAVETSAASEEQPTPGLSQEGNVSSKETSVADDSFADLLALRPLPKVVEEANKKKRGGRKRGYAKILTSTPERQKVVEVIRSRRVTRASSKKSAIECLKGSLPIEDLSANQSVSESQKNPKVGDYIVVAGKSTKNKKSMHFVACITAKDETTSTLHVQRFRQSKKMPDKFSEPAKEDIVKVKFDQIAHSLPPPSTVGGTKRVQSMLSFPIDLSDYSFQQ